MLNTLLKGTEMVLNAASEQVTAQVGANPERNRAYNRRVILGLLREHGQIGRADMARHLHLTQQAVANIISELVDEGLVIETGRIRTKRGQPPKQFALNPDGPVTIGVEIAAGNLVTVVQKLTGELGASQIQSLADTSPTAVAASISISLGRILDAGKEVIGIGAVMPGPFEVEGMSHLGFATLKGWQGVNPERFMREATGIDFVLIENDATAAAVQESLHGLGRDAQSFCYIYFGTGVGLGIIEGGRPLRGAFGNAGEIGQIALPSQSGKMALPLEAVASVYTLRSLVENDCSTPEQTERFMALDPSSDPRVAQFVVSAADYLLPMIALLENIFDPETIILGGGLPPKVLGAILIELHALPVTVSTRAGRVLPRVQAGATGQLIAALGAAAMPLLEASSAGAGHVLE